MAEGKMIKYLDKQLQFPLFNNLYLFIFIKNG